MSPRALANQERAAQSRRLQQWVRSLLLTIATLLSLGTVGLLAADQLYRPDAFVIDQLKIRGAFKHLDPAEIEAVVNRRALGNFFSIELDSIEREVEDLNWVMDAEVRREWPNTLAIHVTEQKPVMRWGDQAWVNTIGDVVELPFKPNSSHSIVLNGHERDSRLMMERGLQWRELLASYGLKLHGLKLSESHAYQLELSTTDSKQPFLLQLGRRDVTQRLQRFLMLYKNQLNPEEQRLVRVDARYPDGVAIRAEAVQPDQSDAKEAETNDE